MKIFITFAVSVLLLFTACATVNPHTNPKSRSEIEIDNARMIGAVAGAATGFTISLFAYKNTNEGWYADPELKSPLTWFMIGGSTVITYFVGWVTGDMVYALTHPDGDQ